ncbi:ABC transporter permease [Cohnella sp. 56]|uniref:ABC transporter permease n=1 Tax=Cohnella sp. 56 TaxID=3113722 RepID=UPI0030E9C81A
MLIQKNTVIRHGEASRKSRPTLLRKLARQRNLQFMVLPGIVWMFIFCYIPIFWLIIAFKEYDITKPMLDAPWVGLKQFKEMFADSRFYEVLVNTAGISFYKLIVAFPIPILFALLLNEIVSPRFKKLIQTVTYLPHFISWAIFGGILLNWLSDTGFVNNVLIALHLQSEPVFYNSVPDYFWGIAVTSDVWKEMGWNAIIYIAAISTIDQDIYQSADIDGAGRFRKMWYITVQNIRPTIAILFILAVSNVLSGSFEQIFVLRNNMNLPKSETLDLFVYNMGIVSGRFSYSTAVLLCRSVVSLLLLLLANFVSRKLTKESLF